MKLNGRNLGPLFGTPYVGGPQQYSVVVERRER